MNKLAKILIPTVGILGGVGLLYKAGIDDAKYEAKMIQKDKTEVFEDKGHFRDRNNGYEYLGGLSLLLVSIYGASKLK